MRLDRERRWTRSSPACASTMPALRVVTQPHHASSSSTRCPDDVAAAFDCESQVTLGDPKQVKRAYGNYFGATFLVDGRPQ